MIVDSGFCRFCLKPSWLFLTSPFLDSISFFSGLLWRVFPTHLILFCSSFYLSDYCNRSFPRWIQYCLDVTVGGFVLSWKDPLSLFSVQLFSFALPSRKKGFVIPTKTFVKIGITKNFCYNNKMFSSINKMFACCSKIFGRSDKKFICCP